MTLDTSFYSEYWGERLRCLGQNEVSRISNLDSESVELLTSIGIPESHNTFGYQISRASIFERHFGEDWLELGEHWASIATLCLNAQTTRVFSLEQNIHSRQIDTSFPSYVCSSLFTYFMLITLVEYCDQKIFGGDRYAGVLIEEDEAKSTLMWASAQALIIDPTIVLATENMWLGRLAW